MISENYDSEPYEVQTQKHISNFTKILPSHVNEWRTILQEATKPLQTLANQAEQLYHVERAKITWMNNFVDAQKSLQYRILMSIEEELKSIKHIVESLNKANHDLKNKLTVLERSTLNLDWDSDSLLIRGSGIQPSLTRLLQNGLEFTNHFLTAARKISEELKNLDIRKEFSVENLRNALNVTVEDSKVQYLLAITQYINNENSVS